MKKILLLVIASIMAMSASTRETIKKVRLYNGNAIVAEQNYDEIDSIVFVDVEKPIVVPNGAISGRFTINANGDQIFFSQGNLQYQASTNTWRFAENQYDKVGSDNKYSSSTYDGWIDWFGWGTSGYDNTVNDPFAINYQPWSKSYTQLSQQYTIKGTEIESINCEMQQITGECDTTWIGGNTYNSDDVNYYGYGPSLFMTDANLTGTSANYDWGIYNAISNGGNIAGLWRTLTKAEWDYIFNTRPLAQYLRSQATVCGKRGYVLLPDDFTLPEGLSWSYQTNNWDTNTYDSLAWSAMEAIGAVFLPAAGDRNMGGWSSGGSGSYWSASYGSQSGAWYVHFDSSTAHTSYGYTDRCNGISVRLVQDVE